MNRYPKLFAPGKIANLTIKNRIVMTAMGVCLSGSDGQASPEIIRYYEARAKGGVGMIITEITCIDETEGRGMPPSAGPLCPAPPDPLPAGKGQLKFSFSFTIPARRECRS